MRKIKLYILVGGLVTLSLILTGAKVAQADTATTFPVDKAGIAAYLKLDLDFDNPESENYPSKVLTRAWYYFNSREVQDQDYVIGTVKVENGFSGTSCGYSWSNLVHLYIGRDGWMIAYYLKDEPASKIMMWKNYDSDGIIWTTILEAAINSMSEDLGVTSSTSLKYYDFEFPEAKKLTVAVEELEESSLPSSNSFSVTIPAQLAEVSYSIYGMCNYRPGPVILRVDENEVFNSVNQCRDGKSFYGFYGLPDEPSTYFPLANVPHLVTFSKQAPYSNGLATVFIY